MREIGRVIESDERYALVEVRRKSACEGCHKGAEGCDACSLFIADAKHCVSAENPLHAKVGDRVLLEATSSRMLWYAFLVFILPLIIAGVFYALADAFHAQKLVSISLAAIGMILAYIIIGRMTKKLEAEKRSVSVVRVLSDREITAESENEESAEN